MRHRSQPPRAQAETALAVHIRHGEQRFLRRAHNQRQNHNRQRQRAGEHRVAETQLARKEQHAEQAVDNRGNAGKRLCRHPNQRDDFASLFRVFRQINGRRNAERNGRQQRQQRHRAGVENGGQHRLIIGGIRERKHVRIQIRHAADEHIAHQKTQRQHRNRRRQMRQQRQRQRTDMVSISSHAFFPLLSTEKHRFISRMNTNSTTPVAISASRCSPAA